MHIIAADVGGTKTLLAIADVSAPYNILFEVRYPSARFETFEPMLHQFIDDARSAGVVVDDGSIDALILALPGLVGEASARLTNLPWVVKKQSLRDGFNIDSVYFINDFQASAFGITQLQEQDRIVLNRGISGTDVAVKNCTRVAVGAGTGLGVAWVEDEMEGGAHCYFAHDTEGGHIDFAPVDDTQIHLLKFLLQRHEHVSYERILSGDGLVSLYQFFSGYPAADISAEWINQHADTDDAAGSALSLFVQIYGAYIGNIALLFKPYGGIYITGGIAAKIVDKMRSDDFINAYMNKGRMQSLVSEIAVYLVTNERIGVLGALSEGIKMRSESQQIKIQKYKLQQQAIS